MLIASAFALLLGLEAAAPPPPEVPAAPQPLPRPPSTGENPYHPLVRTVHSSYRCRDGTRSITIAYENYPKGRVTALTRNGKAASKDVVDRVNEMLTPIGLLASVFPQCGSRFDSLYLSEPVGGKQTNIWVVWSPEEARLIVSRRE